jgi:hypothetical protein
MSYTLTAADAAQINDRQPGSVEEGDEVEGLEIARESLGDNAGDRVTRVVFVNNPLAPVQHLVTDEEVAEESGDGTVPEEAGDVADLDPDVSEPVDSTPVNPAS